VSFNLDPETFTLYERSWSGYQELYDSFEWELPATFNMAEHVCDRWAADSDRVAIQAENQNGEQAVITYSNLKETTDKLAGFLRDEGVGRGDKVAINIPQKPETIMAHVATWKVGAVSIPLSELFGPDALDYRLDETDAVICLADETNISAIREVSDHLDHLKTILTVDVDSPRAGERDIRDAIEASEPVEEIARTKPEDDAVIIYTSGTTGDPKGVLHGHQLLIGQQPLFATTYSNLELRDDDIFWTPAPWAWVGMFAIVFPPLYHGRPVLAHQRESFDPEKTFELIDQYNLTVISLPPTSMRMMMQVDSPSARYDLSSVRLIPTGGEEVTESIEDWVHETFGGAKIHTAFGQTEANGILGECSALDASQRGTLGRPVPGHEVTVVDRDTAESLDEPDTIGEIAVRYEDDPLLFKKYWNKPEETVEKVQNGWLLTEDLGALGDDGYFRYHSRKDDVIISSGYRISPGEIEDTLSTHPAISDAGVIGVPDEKRSKVPKAFVETTEDVRLTPRLEDEIINHVKENLGKYEYPRAVEDIEELPKTVTGKIRRRDLEDIDDSR